MPFSQRKEIGILIMFGVGDMVKTYNKQTRESRENYDVRDATMYT